MNLSERRRPVRQLFVTGSEETLAEPGWESLVSEVMSLAGTASSAVQPLAESAELPDAVLRLAADRPGPLLYIPTIEPSPGQAKLTRMLVPFDRTVGERRLLRPWIERAQDRGVEVCQLHVISGKEAPAMWEGAGHHARAWLAEVERRHGAGVAGLFVRCGDPAEHILDALAEVDLLLVCWRGDPEAKRARLARRLIGGAPVPLLLAREAPGERRGR